MGGMILTLGPGTDATSRKLKPETIKRVMKLVALYRWQAASLILMVVVDASLGTLSPLLYRNLIDAGILRNDSAYVVKVAIALAFLALFTGMARIAQSYLSAKTGASIAFTLRTRLFEHVQQMSIAFFTHAQTGALINRLSADADSAATAFADTLTNVSSNLFGVVFTLCAMFALSWRISLAAFCLFPVIFLPARFWHRKITAVTREGFDLNNSVSSFLIEHLNVAGAMLSKVFSHTRYDAEIFRKKALQLSIVKVRSALYINLFMTSLVVVTLLATAFTYGLGGVSVIKHAIDLGTLIALASYISQLYGPFLGVSTLYINIITAFISFERIFELLDIEPVIRDRAGAITTPRGSAKISFENVSFNYPSSSDLSLGSLESIDKHTNCTNEGVLNNISFTVEAGQMVALVGRSGAGKTTITQLLTRLYDAVDGRILLNDIDLRDIELESLHQRIGVVSQDPHLFHDTIRANLLYAKPDASDEEIFNVLRAAEMLPLIVSLRDGLDTLVGERGYRFSGGEKQRIAIARLLLKAPDVVILDEATAHLDSRSEAAIQRALEIALVGRTSIVVAHRLSTIVKADQILVVEGGRILERGSHGELLTQSGEYASLYNGQFRSKDPLR